MILTLDDGTVDLDRFEVIRGGRTVRLTRTEHAVLRYLVDRAGRSVDRAHIERDALGYRPGVESRALDTLIYKLRQKIEQDVRNPRHLHSVRGTGYRFEPLTPTEAPVVPAPRAAVSLGSATSFVGRDALKALVRTRLEETRWVSLCGPGGIGKTRLAQEVARAWTEGPVIAAGIGDATGPDAILRSVGEALGVALKGTTLPPRLGEHACLVWLDAVELDPAVGELLASWVAAAPTLKLLVSARTRMRRPGESVIDVPPMTNDEARALFVERARDARLDAALPGPEDPVWSKLLHALDGIPLALELAASRLRVLDLRSLAARIEASPHLLASSAGFPARHTSLEGVLRTSIEALDPSLARTLTETTVFRSPFGLEAAEAVVTTEPRQDLVQTLEALVDHGLVRTEERSGRLRFVLPASVRSLVSPSLELDDPVRARHRAWWSSRCPSHAPDDTYDPDTTLLDGADDLRFLLDEALAEARTRDAVRLFHGLVACIHLNDPSDSLGALAKRLQALPGLEREDEVEILLGRAMALQRQDRIDEAMAVAKEARRHATPIQEARAMLLDAFFELVAGRNTEAELRVIEGIAFARRIPSPLVEGILHGIAAEVLGLAGRPSEQEAHLEAGTALLEAAGFGLLRAQMENRWAAYFQMKGDLTAALRRGERALEAYRTYGQTFEFGTQHNQLAFLWIRMGNLSRAQEHAREALAVARTISQRILEVYARSALGLALYRSGALEEAERCFVVALELADTLADPMPSAELHHGLGALWLDLGDPLRALEHLDRARGVALVSPWMRAGVEAHRAEALGRLGRRPEMEEALAGLSETRELGPRDPMGHHTGWIRSGLAWASVGDVKRAREALEAAEALPLAGHPWAETMRKRLQSAIHAAEARSSRHR